MFLLNFCNVSKCSPKLIILLIKLLFELLLYYILYNIIKLNETNVKL